MPRKILKFRELFLLLGALAIAVVYWLLCPKMDNVVLHRNGESKEVSSLVSIPMHKGEIFGVEMDVDAGAVKTFDIEIHPDDCVTSFSINGTKIPFEKYPGHCDMGKGFVVSSSEIQRYLGSNTAKYHLDLSIRNNGGLGGMNFEFHPKSVLLTVLSVAFFLLVGCSIFLFGLRFNIDRRLLIIFLLGMLIRVVYTQETAYNERSHDVEAHVKYIEIIAMDHHIPKSDECFVCYHPPVYHAVSAGFWNVSRWLSLDSLRVVMWFDFFVSLVALAFGIACIRESLWGETRYIAALLWSLWPCFILASPRIGNDVLFCAMHVVALWACICYLKTNKGKYLLTSVIVAAIAYWVKSTAAITFGIVVFSILMSAIPRVRKGLSRLEWVSIGIFVITGLIVVFRVATASVVGNVNEVDVNSVVYVNNAPGNFLFFDIRSFLTNPYTSPWSDALGRQFFWNYLAKTSLFGEFRLLTTPAGNWLATLISACFLALLGFGIRGLSKLKLSKINVLLVAQAVFFFAAVFALRIQIPYSCSNDFRFIIPVLLSCLPWVATGISGEGTSLKIRVLGGITVAVFVVCSSLLMLSL